MKMIKKKSVLLIIFTFLGSYLTSFIILPASYWKGYFAMPVSRTIIDLLINFLFCIALLGLSHFIDRVLNRKIPWMDHPLRRLLTQTFFQVLGVLLLIICLAIVYELFIGPSNAPSPDIGLRQGAYIIIAIILWALIISTLNTGDFFLRNWQTATVNAAEYKVKAAESKQLAAEIELQALKMQLDPHFVFNNLSVLSELILKDPQLGYEYTANFTRVYRYLLSNAKKKLVPLSEELSFLDAYLFLIRHRMGTGVVFQIDIDKSKLGLLLPPITLQLFIENAMKHNRTEEENPLVIHIFSNDHDELVVSNALLPLIKKPYSTGIGLENIFSRYALLSNRKPTVEENRETFTVKVPLLQ